MLLVYCDARGCDERRAICAARSGRRGSALGMSLLLSVLRREYGLEVLPKIAEGPNGKPFFPERPEIHFSLSHSAGHILCAVASEPLGVDIEYRRSLQPGLSERIMSESERRDFDFFQLWTLRESFFKLTGDGGTLSPRFHRENGEPRTERDDIFCRLYSISPELPAALCAFSNSFPTRHEVMSASQLLKRGKTP